MLRFLTVRSAVQYSRFASAAVEKVTQETVQKTPKVRKIQKVFTVDPIAPVEPELVASVAAVAKKAPKKKAKAVDPEDLGSNIFFWDIETTGLNRRKDQIVEIALLHPHSGASLELLVKPSKEEVTQESFEIHNISNEMLENEPTFKDVWSRVNEWMQQQSGAEEKVLVSHFALSLDIPVLKAEVKRVKRRMPANYILTCSSSIIRARLKKDKVKSKVNLGALKELFDIRAKGEAHRALSDVQVLWDVMLKVLPEEEPLAYLSKALAVQHKVDLAKAEAKAAESAESADKPTKKNNKSNSMWWKWNKHVKSKKTQKGAKKAKAGKK